MENYSISRTRIFFSNSFSPAENDASSSYCPSPSAAISLEHILTTILDMVKIHSMSVEFLTSELRFEGPRPRLGDFGCRPLPNLRVFCFIWVCELLMKPIFCEWEFSSSKSLSVPIESSYEFSSPDSSFLRSRIESPSNLTVGSLCGLDLKVIYLEVSLWRPCASPSDYYRATSSPWLDYSSLKRDHVRFLESFCLNRLCYFWLADLRLMA